MATLYINEYNSVLYDRAVIPSEPAIATQTVAIGSSSAQSATFTQNTRFVLLSTDAICSVAFGSNPTATSSNIRLPADTLILMSVPQNQAYMVAVITNT